MKPKPFMLERYFGKYEFTAPYLLCSSDCESITIDELLELDDGSRERLGKVWLGYTETPGSEQLRQEISKLYKNIFKGEVLVHSGAQEAVYTYMNAMLQPGDHVIVHYPCYQSLEEIPRSIGCEITRWAANERDGWELDPEFLKDNIKSNTKLIVINSPHNPTGYLMSKHKLNDIVKIAAKAGVILFSDEVYRLLEHYDADTLPAACDLYENAVSLGVMSKTFGLAGLRIGWIATRNKTVLKSVTELKDYTTICSSAPSEFLAEVALRKSQLLIDRNVKIIRSNLALLDSFFSEYRHIFSWVRPRAGSVAFPKLNIDTPVESFCSRLVEEQGVLLLPGTCFGPEFNNFRIGFGRNNMPEALEHFREFLKKHY